MRGIFFEYFLDASFGPEKRKCEDNYRPEVEQRFSPHHFARPTTLSRHPIRMSATKNTPRKTPAFFTPSAGLKKIANKVHITGIDGARDQQPPECGLMRAFR